MEADDESVSSHLGAKVRLVNVLEPNENQKPETRRNARLHCPGPL